MKVYKENVELQNNQYVILDEEDITKTFACECFTNYGQKVGCFDAGCYTAETSDSFSDDDEESHIEVLAYQYHDGQNWRSLLVGINDYDQSDLTEVDSDLNQEILNAYNNAYWGAWTDGICKGDSNKYEFIKSQWAGSYGIADVIVK
jgi:hypothetical protein